MRPVRQLGSVGIKKCLDHLRNADPVFTEVDHLLGKVSFEIHQSVYDI